MIGAGAGAFDSLRIEKGYRSWGADVHTEYNPYEAGLGWTVKLDKADAAGQPIDFIGRNACAIQKAEPLKRKLCCLKLDDPKAVLFGYEPIFEAGGRSAIGNVSSGNFGYSVGAFIAFGYLPAAQAALGTTVEIEYFGERFSAIVTDDPLFDAKMLRMKA